MRITTSELRQAVDLLLAQFEANEASEWDVDRDFYWDVPTDARYDSYDAPSELDIGQLTADIKRVKAIAVGEEAPVPLGLVWVANILRLAGEEGIVAMKRKAR